jgi:glutaredoxin
MDFALFTYPGCLKCEKLKKYLVAASLPVVEHNLVSQEGKIRIREFLPFVRRDEKGGIILPALIVHQDGKAEAVLNSQEELEAWLKSRA